MARRAEKLVSETASPIAMRLAQRYGSLKSVLSAGIMALNELTPAERERMLDKANGFQPADESQKAAEGARFMMTTWQKLNDKEKAVALQFLSPDESRAVKELLASLNPENQANRHKKQKVV